MTDAKRLPIILELVRRCEYCRREMTTGAAAFRENPFCRECLHDRIAAAAIAQGPTELRFVGDYAEVIPVLQTPSSGERQRPDA